MQIQKCLTKIYNNAVNWVSTNIIKKNKDLRLISVKDFPKLNKERAYKDPDVVRPNLENISNELNWKPSTNIETGIEKTVSWYSENKEFLNDIVYIQEKIDEKNYCNWWRRIYRFAFS